MKPITFFFAVLSLCSVVLAEDPPALSPKDKLVVETVLRLKSFDIESSPPAKAAILRYLQARPGTDQYFELINRFKPVEFADELAKYCLEHADETGGVRGAELLFAMQQEKILQEVIDGDDEFQGIAAVKLIGHAGEAKMVTMLLPLITSRQTALSLRASAVSAVGKRIDGQNEILALVTSQTLSEELRFAAANVLLSSTDETIATEAAKHLELPATADRQPLPTVSELVQQIGDANAGESVFRTTGICIQCHKVRGEGKEVGPDLTEIGSKLSREAMYVAILDPSAAISHNYETYSVVTEEGSAITGLLISQTDDSLTLRTQQGIDKTIDRDAVEIFGKQPKSLMPQDLQKLLTAQQLVDTIEYLLTLRTAGGSPVQK